MSQSREIASDWKSGKPLQDRKVVVDLGEFRIAIRSNSSALLDRLERYFSHFRSADDSDVEITAIEAASRQSRYLFQDWKREPGKTGRKDAICDLDDGRLIRKVRTEMLFLQSAVDRIAYGPCLANDNQVINFLNCQYMNWLQRNGALICHASGIVMDGSCLAIAGFSGGGKSTLMLHLLGNSSSRYLTNDRLFLRTESHGCVSAVGIPKMPRVNPGTILSMPALRGLLSDARCDTLNALPSDELWNLEEKYDVDVTTIYGPNRMTRMAPLKHVLILNWRRDTNRPCLVSPVDIDTRPDLLAALVKSPGPFYQHPDGRFHRDDMAPDLERYRNALRGITVWEAEGRVDFEFAADRCRDLMRTKSCSRN